MGFFTGASDALQEALIQQEEQRRREMLDAIAADDRRSRDEDRKTNREIQRENMESQKAARTQAEALQKQKIADAFEESTAMDTELDEAGAGILEGAGRGAHIKRTAPSVSARVTDGLGAPTADNPLGLDTSTAPAVKMVEGKRLFGGTAKQQAEAKQRESRSAYIKGLPAGPQRSHLEAQDATGDTSLPATLYDAPKEPTKPSSVLEYEYAKSQGYKGTFAQYQNEDANRRERAAARPSAPQIFYGDDGKPRAIQFMPDGTSREVPLPAGMSGKIQPKPVKTAAEIEKERFAGAKGAAEGKAAASPGFDWGNVARNIPIVKKFAPVAPVAAHAPTSPTTPAAGAAPAVEEWGIVNGKPVRIK
jgi:hypothetical protein